MRLLQHSTPISNWNPKKCFIKTYKFSLLSLLSFFLTSDLYAELHLELVSSQYSRLDFQFQNGSRGRYDLPEIMGGGMAVADFDNDGLPDIFMCQGGPIVNIGRLKSEIPDNKAQQVNDPPCIWFRNLGKMQFERVSVISGDGPSYAMGAWPCDFDGDGKTDLFITGWQGWKLLKNLGNWNFLDVTENLGPKIPEWSTAAVWADFNNDNHWDLFVGGYLKYNPGEAPFCAAPDGMRDYCGPEDFEAVSDRLYYGDGQGGFEDVTDRLGLNSKKGRALGSIAFDFNGDMKLDLFVANDGTPNQLYLQKSEKLFEEVALSWGVALQRNGEPLAGMGVALARLQPYAKPSLFVTNFHHRGTVLFENIGQALFEDRSERYLMSALTRDVNGFGIAVTDLNNDGKLELIQANGHVLSRERLGTPLKMPVTILTQNDQGLFEKAGLKAHPNADQKIIGRGLIVSDLDADNRLDILISRLDGSPLLFKNISQGKPPLQHKLNDNYFGGSYLSGTIHSK